MTTIDSEGHVLLDVTRPDGSHEEVELSATLDAIRSHLAHAPNYLDEDDPDDGFKALYIELADLVRPFFAVEAPDAR